MFRIFSRVGCVGTVGVLTGSYTFYRRNNRLSLQCQSNHPNIPKTKSTNSTIPANNGFGGKIVSGCIDIYNKLSDGIVNGELFHELRRKEVQMELLMIIAPLIFGAFTSGFN